MLKCLFCDGMLGKDDDYVLFDNIMDKLCYLEFWMEDFFGSLKFELLCFRYEFNEEIEKVKLIVNDVEILLNVVWDIIKDF